jgi:hypothetical protein
MKDYKQEQKATREALKPRWKLITTSKNRAVRRMRIIDRTMTRRGYAYGLFIGSKEYNLIHHIAERQER